MPVSSYFSVQYSHPEKLVADEEQSWLTNIQEYKKVHSSGTLIITLRYKFFFLVLLFSVWTIWTKKRGLFEFMFLWVDWAGSRKKKTIKYVIHMESIVCRNKVMLLKPFTLYSTTLKPEKKTVSKQQIQSTYLFKRFVLPIYFPTFSRRTWH